MPRNPNRLPHCCVIATHILSRLPGTGRWEPRGRGRCLVVKKWLENPVSLTFEVLHQLEKEVKDNDKEAIRA